MITIDALPDWPPRDGEPIGEDRARAYIAWIRAQAPPLVREARRQLQARYGNATTHTAAVTADQLATWKLSEGMERLNIGTVWCGFMAGSFAVVNIDLRRDGHLEIRPGMNMHDR